MKQSTTLNSTYNSFRNHQKVENGSIFMGTEYINILFPGFICLHAICYGYCGILLQNLFLKRNRNMLSFISNYKAEVL